MKKLAIAAVALVTVSAPATGLAKPPAKGGAGEKTQLKIKLVSTAQVGTTTFQGKILALKSGTLIVMLKSKTKATVEVPSGLELPRPLRTGVRVQLHVKVKDGTMQLLKLKILVTG